jgi:CubicO group peptidase (beta-lactamase class C family)
VPRPFEAAASLVAAGLADHAFPCASIEVGRRAGRIWTESFGALTYDPGAPPCDRTTIFDLASLTKVIATTTLAMRAVDERLLSLDDPVARWLREWRGADREAVTIGDLLAHASGLPAYLPFFRDHAGRVEFEPAICQVPLEYVPRTQSIYSDLGFILLGFIFEDVRAGHRQRQIEAAGIPVVRGVLDVPAQLRSQFRTIASFLTSDPLAFSPPRAWRPRIAPTEVDEWRGRLLVGEVHDENAWALGGAAGHAGLFGTASAVGAFARAVLRTLEGERILADPATFHDFIRRTEVPGSSRALGWDTMLPTSSCGARLSPTAIGHTGFTGTSLWIDRERDLYIVLLTNRVHPSRENEKLRALRPKIHDAIVDAVTDGGSK